VAVVVSMDQLGAELRRQRAGRSLRDVEAEIGISAATLSRVERGSTPDLEVVRKLAAWLGVTVQAAGEEKSEVKTDADLRRTIAVHLRANKRLPQSVAEAIIESFDLVMEIEMKKAGINTDKKRR
jgi:transcriptional regulator with XRE-family HTH domain